MGASYCRDPKMLETYRTGGDIHAATTSVIFGIPYAQAMDKNALDYRIYVISSTPEMPIPIFILQVCMSVKYHQATFAL